jgi:hypothetical protein
MIPLYGFQAVGGKIYQLDDPSVVKDGCAADGTGGTAFVPFYTTRELRLTISGYVKLRRLIQKVDHAGGSATLQLTAIRDGGDGTVISRTLGPSDPSSASFPLNDPGSDLQVKVELTSYDVPVAFSDAEFYAVVRRQFRA